MAATTARNHCCVPKCTSTSSKQPYLSFHSFPSDGEIKKQWIHAIRRDEGQYFTVLRGSTYVCSQHFAESDYSKATGRKRLKCGVIPSRFEWNDGGSVLRRPNVCDKTNARREFESGINKEQPAVCYGPVADHDYSAAPPPGKTPVYCVMLCVTEQRIKNNWTRLNLLFHPNIFKHST